VPATRSGSATSAVALFGRERPAISTLAAVGAVLIAIAVTAYVAADARIPVMWNDEAGYLSGAQILAGVGEPRDLSGRGYYYLGFSYLLVPLWWISSHPEVVYRLAIVLNALLGLATILPLMSIGRSLGLRRVTAVTLAAIVVAAPGRSLMAGYVLSENLQALLVATVVVLAIRLWRNPSWPVASLLLAAAVWAFLTHGRLTPVLVGAIVLVVIARRRSPWSVAVLVAAALALAAGGYLLYRHVAGQLYHTDSDRESVGISRILGLNPGAAAIEASGQLWYLQIAWWGTALIGIVFLVSRSVAEVRTKRFGPYSIGLIVFVGLFGVSVSWLATRVADGTARLDMYTYGRYLDPLATALAFVGLVWLWKGMSKRAAVVALATQSVVVVTFVAIDILAITPTNTSWVPTSVPGLLSYNWPLISSAGGPPWLLASLVGLGAALVIFVVRNRPVVIALVLTVALAGTAVLGEYRSLRPFFAGWYDSFTLAEQLPDSSRNSLSFDIAGLDAENDTVSRNAYQFLLGPEPLPIVDSTVTAPTTEYVIARSTWPYGESIGATRVLVDSGMFDNALWRMPDN
jgi:hypothetical protein